MSDNARDFLRRVSMLRDSMLYPVRGLDTFTLECRVREDAAYLIGWLA